MSRCADLYADVMAEPDPDPEDQMTDAVRTCTSCARGMHRPGRRPPGLPACVRCGARCCLHFAVARADGVVCVPCASAAETGSAA